MLIKTKPSAYFFSESIFMNPGTSKEVSFSDLSDVQVEDIYEGMITGRLIVDEKEALISEFNQRLAKTGKISPDITSGITAKVKALEDSIKQTVKQIPSTEEVQKLLTTLKEAEQELTGETPLTVPNFVSIFKSNLI